jgi:inorganic pyrophosphatase
MTDYLDLPIGNESPEIVTAVIEIPQGCINKYEYDKKLRVFRLDRNLHSPVHYPGDCGFIPRTLASIYKGLEGKRTKVLGWKDRDAAHAIIQSSHQRFPATDARLVGAMSD